MCNDLLSKKRKLETGILMIRFAMFFRSFLVSSYITLIMSKNEFLNSRDLGMQPPAQAKENMKFLTEICYFNQDS